MRIRSLIVFVVLAVLGAPVGAAWAGPADAEPDFEALNRKFMRYEPIYALLGYDGVKDAKFQLSFKYNLFSHAYLGYLHTTIWDINHESSPFRDTSFRPTLFYHFNEEGPEKNGPRSWLGFVVGGEHESNGKGGPDSRSLNSLYLKPVYTYDVPKEWSLRIVPRITHFTGVSGGNKDIAEYRGHVDLQMIYDSYAGLLRGLQVAALVRKGTEGSRWTTEVDVSFGGKNWPVRIHVQYFSGYGETLLEYTRRYTQVRAGIMLQQW